MHTQTPAQLELDIFPEGNVTHREKKIASPEKHLTTIKPNKSHETGESATPMEDTFQTVKFIPLAQIFERHGAFYALNYAQEQILLSKRSYKGHRPLYIAVDRWRGSFLFSNYVALIGELLEGASQIGRFRIIGPTTAEILDIIGARSETTCHISQIREVLHELASNGMTELSGGTDLIIHKVATEMNFSISVSHRVNLEEIGQNKLNYFPQDFFRDLFFIKNHLCKKNQCKSWFLWCGKKLASFPKKEQEELTPKLLRLISIARLLLPQNVAVKSSISSYGLPFTREALDIGASGGIYIGLDQSSAENLGILTRQEIETKISKNMEVTAFL